ncbi:MAG: TIGR03667 family PPOX class F420-dependent oxidoreductase [Anaerolineales bacterium]|jgi:PPOX class probable F420-dependent enzyme
MLDFSTGFGRHVGARLRRQQVIWLTTVDRRLCPQPRPVWFQWNGSTILIFSQRQGAKVRHIQRNPHVALNLNSDPSGNEVTVILGQARALKRWPSRARLAEYFRKYRRGLKELGISEEAFRKDYCVPIEIRPTTLRGF